MAKLSPELEYQYGTYLVGTGTKNKTGTGNYNKIILIFSAGFWGGFHCLDSFKSRCGGLMRRCVGLVGSGWLVYLPLDPPVPGSNLGLGPFHRAVGGAADRSVNTEQIN